MTNEQVITTLAGIVERTQCATWFIATIAGVSPQMFAHALAMRRMPVRSDARRKLARFADLNRLAQRREDLRIPPEPQ